MATGDNNYKVRLISVASFVASVGLREQVIFEVTPKFSESREIEYTPVSPVHMPGSMQVYKNTKSRRFNIGARFISRTMEEATVNMLYLQTLRGWTMPYFGSTSTLGDNKAIRDKARSNQSQADSSANQPEDRQMSGSEIAALRQKQMNAGTEMLGAPPDVLYLYAYSTSSNDGDTSGSTRPSTYGVNINKIPVVITSLNITYPDDVDYIPTYSNVDTRFSEPFPIKMDVDITLVETHSPREYEMFDLLKYKRGTLVNF